MTSAKPVETNDIILLLYIAKWASGNDKWVLQLSNVGSKLIQGKPRPLTTKVSSGTLKLLENDHQIGKKKIIATNKANNV